MSFSHPLSAYAIKIDRSYILVVCSLKKKKKKKIKTKMTIKNKMTSHLSSHYAVQIFPSIIALKSQSHWCIVILFASRCITPKYDFIGQWLSGQWWFLHVLWPNMMQHICTCRSGTEIWGLIQCMSWVDWFFCYILSLSGSVQHDRISILG